MANKRKRVIVGMSAGVDSSMAAAILKEQSYDVVGVFLHFWKEPGQNQAFENKCCSLESQQDARKVAQILDIPFYVVNVAKEFKKEVVDNFLKETKAGLTPNPCVVCNKKIKFNFLFKKMLEMDTDYVATGHYAKIDKIDGKYHLYPACDSEKDQTYFLYNLSQKQLGKILFPLGNYKKAEVRKMAEKKKLPVFNKKESQNLCFTWEKSPNEFIKRNIALSSGDIMTTEGVKIGTHEGLELYTIGQRKGINIGGTGPYYVVNRDFKKNQLIVTNNENDKNIYKKKMLVEITNWVIGKPKFPLEIKVKIRYRHPQVCCIINPVKSDEVGSLKAKFNGVKNTQKPIYMVEFVEMQKAVTPGQSAVFYGDNGEVLGGGIIN